MTKIDPYKHKEKYFRWKAELQSGMPGISKQNSDLLIRYISDMETGLNVALHVKRGARSYIRLNTLRTRILSMTRDFEKRFNLIDVTNITEEQLHGYFLGMRNGTITRKDGKEFMAVKDYVKDFKAFWHWWMKVNRKQGVEIKEITLDLDTSGEKPKWVYLREDEITRLADSVGYDYKVLIWFIFDTGIRSPTELINIKVSDFYNDFKELNIREEISKTFGRRIKIMLSSSLIKEYVRIKNLSAENYLFKIRPSAVNRYLKRAAKRLFGDKETLAGQKYSELTLYDFRHCSSCYWLPRYKSESALKYRFGWKKCDKIHYYSEFLGMEDTITQDDVLLDVTKTEIEKELQKTRKENEIIQEKMKTMEFQMVKIMELTNRLGLVA